MNIPKQAGNKILVAAYLRMSTTEQVNSIDNQSSFIKQYADSHNMKVVKEYKDVGKSGLTFTNRPAMMQLLSDVLNDRSDFHAILVYDMSRWSRSQNPKESISNQYYCELKGVRLICCNGNGPKYDNYEDNLGADLGEFIDRYGAADFSKKLSLRVFRGQCRLITLGYRQGGHPGFGLRRLLLDEKGNKKFLLKRGDRKSLQTDRVILVEGPAHEVEIVHQIYHWFVDDRKTEKQIAELLNSQGIKTDLDRAWTRGTIHQILINEKYIGHNVFNRRSFKLKSIRIKNPPEDWVRKDNAFKAIVSVELFQQAQKIIINRSCKVTDQQMLQQLEKLWQTKGTLSGLLIDEHDNMPSSAVYRSRFGGLLKAYTLIGYKSDRDYAYIEVNKKLRMTHQFVLDQVTENLRQRGTIVEQAENGLISINNELSLSLIISRCMVKSPTNRQWLLRLDKGLNPDITVAIRMCPDNINILDYYIFPHIAVREATLHLKSQSHLGIDVYRFDSLEFLYQLTSHVPLSKVS